MPRPDTRLVLVLLAAGATSFLAGFLLMEAVSQMPCHGETLACNIDQAIGAYGVVIWSILGPLVFALTLFIAPNRVAIAGATTVLLLPIVAFFLIGFVEHSLVFGFEPYRQGRTFLTLVVPPVSVVVVQALMLRLAIPSAGGASSEPASGE